MRTPALAAIVAFLAFDAALVAWFVMSPGSSGQRQPERVAETPVPPAPAPDASAGPESAFRRLGPPGPGQWRAVHPDDIAMSFEDYVESGPVRADAERTTLAFLPVGGFGAEERAALDAAAEFTSIWFGMPIRVLPGEPLTDDEDQFRVRDDMTGRAGRQYRTGWFLNTLLPDRRPEDGVVLLGVTMADIYPGASWNYVFGEADLRRRVGVYSLARYFPEFWGLARTPESLRLALLRTLKVVVHETGHTFGLEHCVEWECAMNGSNSLAETDGQPLHLCPASLRKLAWNRGLDVRERHRRLAEFLDARGLVDEAKWYRATAAAAR
jgi:archaemetzincin